MKARRARPDQGGLSFFAFKRDTGRVLLQSPFPCGEKYQRNRNVCLHIMEAKEDGSRRWDGIEAHSAKESGSCNYRQSSHGIDLGREMKIGAEERPILPEIRKIEDIDVYSLGLR